jgi:hypothetical protein
MKDDLAPPDVKTLTAYFDGELNRAGDAATRRQVEAWLARNPAARAELTEWRRLRQLWDATTPAEPGTARAAKLLARLRHATTPPRDTARRWRLAMTGVAVAAVAATVLLVVWFINQPTPPNGLGPVVKIPTDEVLEVAQWDEVVVLRITGEDTASLIVGILPVTGNLELADPGEVSLKRVCPSERNRLDFEPRPHPMIWTRATGE